jgi:catalase
MKVSVIADDLAQGARAPNYYPNSFPGPKPDISAKWPTYELKGKWGRYEYVHPNDDYVQPAALYNKVMTDVDRAHLISNIVGHLGGAKKRYRCVK